MDSEPRLQRRTWASAVARALVLLIGFVCMVGFAVALAKVTLVPSAASVDLTHTNLTPGQSIRTYADQPAFRDTVKQLGGNVLLGMPFGVLLPVLIPKARGLLRVVLVTAVVMLLVETAQGLLITGRAFDIDDVILNTTGALIGYLLIGRRLGRALHPRRRHWWQRADRAPRPDSGRSTDGNSGRSTGPSRRPALPGALLPGALRTRPAEKEPPGKAPPGKAPAKKSSAKKAPAKKAPAKKTSAKQTSAKKAPAKQTSAKKTPAKQPPAKKSASGDQGARWWSAVRLGRRSVPRRP